MVNAESSILDSAVAALEANGATRADLGLAMANNIFANNDSTGRNKIVIMFTDGEPNGWSGFDNSVANNTITQAKALKDSGVKVYTVGLGDADLFTNTTSSLNKYMNYVSSNYPDAESMSNPGDKVENSNYFSTAITADSLTEIFQSISESVQSISLDENTVIRDVMSAYFEVPAGTETSDIKLYIADYAGDGQFSEPVAVSGEELENYTITIENGVVSVKGFDFEPVIDKEDGTVEGKKLIIEIPIQVKDSAKVTEANQENSGREVNSNNTLELTAAVANSDAQKWDFPNPEVTFPVWIDGDKVWADASDQDGKRPEKITVTLRADGEEIATKEVTGTGDSWSWNFGAYPKYKTDDEGNLVLNDEGNPVEIVYSIDEVDVPEEYTSKITGNAADGFTVTNSYTPETTKVSVVKEWNDNNNEAGKRPSSVEVQLYAGKTAVGDPVTLSESNDWQYEWTDLAKYKAGVEIAYSVAETTDLAALNYSSEVTGTTAEGFTITNSYPAVRDISVTKVWEDGNDQDRIRPESVNVQLYADGTAQGAPVELTADNNLSHIWENVFKYKTDANGDVVLDDDGNPVEIEYTVDEPVVPDGYEKTVSGTAANGFTVTNTHTPAVTTVTVNKVWADNGDQDGLRPDSITVQLKADGSAYGDSVTLSGEDNEWTHTWKNLPQKSAGVNIAYTVAEVKVPDGYEQSVTGDASTGFTITNTHTPETTEVSGSKTWVDNTDQDGKRPESITINLLADGVVKESRVVKEDGQHKWTWSFTNLPKYKDGKEIKYTITEDPVESYTTTVDGYNVTNTHSPEKVMVEGSKTWDDGNNQDGKRPESITIRLYADGSEVASKTVTEKEGWKWSFTNLPKYVDGQEIIYTITEDAVEGYTTTVDGYNVTNKYTPEVVNVSGNKNWDDDRDRDGVRPGSITVNLLADGKPVAQQTVTAANDWTWNFTNLDKYADGKEIVYTITENPIDGYATTVNGYNVTNKHELTLIDINGSKTWNDDNNRDGLRPESITIHLYANGTEVEHLTKTVTADKEGNWTWSFKKLPKYMNGQEIQYTITEDAVAGYETTVKGFDVTNTHEPETTSVSGSKTWNDNDDQDGKRPDSITIRLLANGVAVVDEEGEPVTATVTAEDNWAWSFTDLPKNDNGKEITYTVTEDEVKGYTTAINGYDITNTYAPEKTSVNGAKTWNDGNDQDGVRPESITINLLADGKEVAEKTVTAEDNWAWSFSDLPKYRDQGTEIVYTITEDEVKEYETVIDGFNVTNSRTPVVIEVSGSKTWNDAGNQDGIRPDSITINLLADGEEIAEKTVTAEDNWAWSFENLPRYKAGKEIVYTVTEDAVEGYKATVNGFDVVNTHTPATTSVSGTKTWDDADDQDGKRPASITINLLADGKIVDSTTANEASGWTYEFTNLPKYKEGAVGEEVVYTITEEEVAEYKTSINGYDVTNSHTPETIEINGTKTWNDADDQDGVRPASITVRLLADGAEVASKKVTASNDWKWSFTNMPKYEDGELIIYTVTEDTIDGYTPDDKADDFIIENTHAPGKTSVSVSKAWNDANDQDGKRPESVTVRLLADGVEIESAVLSEENSWTHTWTELDEKADGEAIEYTVTEDEVADYDTEITGDAKTGYTVTNTHTPEVVTMSGSKTWADANDQDGVRPDSVTINLLANGVVVDSITVDENDEWKWSFTDKPKYKDGKEIVYVIQEVKDNLKDSYDVEIGGFDVENTHVPATTSVHVAKNWNDDNDRDDIRPDSITINLLADGEVVASQTTAAATGWAAEFNNLPVYRDGGTKIVYTVEEITIDGYETTYITNGENNFTVSNTHEPEKTSVKGKKSWNDKWDQDGKRPGSITVYLLANGEKVDSKVVTADDNWKYEFTDLNKYEAGEEIVYTVEEERVEHYTSEVNGYNIENTYVPETTEVKVTKTWADADDQDGKRPESITINLLADGKVVDTVQVTDVTDWTHTFKDLPKYKNQGTKIVYTITEEEVAGYEIAIDGFNLTNTHTPETVDISGSKTWSDADDQDGKRPESITINLLANGNKVDSVTVSEADDWSWSFKDLPKYKDGKVITYTTSETAIADYSTDIIGNNVTNTHTPDKTSVSVSKAWDDANNQDGIRPAGIEVQLLADGDVKDTVVLDESNDWTKTWSELDMYDDGEEIDYTVIEIDVPAGYSAEITGDAEEGYVVTNTHEPATTVVSGTKTWADVDDQDGKRPEAITVLLLANGAQIDSKVVSEENGWDWTFKDLPEYKDGVKINYQIEEVVIDEYETSIDQITGEITNRHDPELTFVQVAKSWKDNNDQDGIRPDEITVNLLADGKKVDSKTVTAADDWATEFTDLPKYKDGKLIEYTITEDKVKGYETEIVVTKDYVVVVNTHEPEKTSVEGTKTWKDKDNQDGIRPASVTVNLYADGTKVDTETVTGANGWTYSFDNLPKFENGKEITYTVSETPVKGYETTIDGFDITNSHEPEKTSVKGTKTWDDEDDQDGKRPESITVQLRVNGQVWDSKVVTEKDNWTYEWKDLSKYYNGKEVKYTVTESLIPGYTPTHDGYNITNSYKPGVVNVHVTKDWVDQNDLDGIRPDSVEVELYANGEATGKVVTLTAENGWHGGFNELDEYADGEKITYTVKEVEVAEGYTSKISGSVEDGFTIVNTHEPVQIKIDGTKTWDDADDQDGKRPESITVTLLANGEAIDSKEVTAADGWKYDFGMLNKYYNGGKEIKYEVIETKVPGYESTVDGLDITNTHKPETKDIEGSKTWDDNFDQDGMRPDEITVNLLADGLVVDTVTVTEKDGWAWAFEDVPVYKDGKVIEYTITENRVKGYEAVIEGYDITNVHEPETTEITGSKTWDDADNQDGKRPEKITVRLLADGVEVAADIVGAKDDWTWLFEDLPVYDDGELIEYEVEEVAVDGYKAIANGYDITNVHKPEVTSVEGTKTWDDADDQDGIRPESITINLLADGKVIDTAAVTAADAWAWAFENLPVYANGKAITYTIEEKAVEGYTPSYDGFDVTNTHTPETTEVSGSKTWDDADNQDGIRPDEITVRLLADGTEVDSIKVTAADDWSWTFKDLPKYNNGKEIVYTITEDAVENYGTSVNGYNVTNAYTPEQTSVTVTKAWDDADDQDGVRPEHIEVQLYADGVAYGEPKVLYAENNWTFTWTELAMNADGAPVEYTVKEVALDEENYTAVITGNAVEGYIITNTHEPATTDISFVKEWVEPEGEESARPESITVNLLADGVIVESVTVDAEAGWAWTFEDLPVYADGAQIEYTVSEDAVEDYEAEITGDAAEGFVITNTLTGEPGESVDDGDFPENEEPGTPDEPDKDGLTDKDGSTQTGDNFSMFFWMMLALAGAGGAATTLTFRRKAAK